MRRLLGLLALCAYSAFAQVHDFSASLSAPGTTNASWVDSNYHTVQVVVVSPTVCTVRLEGSLDGANWFDLSGSQTCTSSTMFHVDGKPAKFARVNLLTYSGDAQGASVKISYRGTN